MTVYDDLKLFDKEDVVGVRFQTYIDLILQEFHFDIKTAFHSLEPFLLC